MSEEIEEYNRKAINKKTNQVVGAVRGVFNSGLTGQEIGGYWRVSEKPGSFLMEKTFENEYKLIDQP